MFEIGRKRPRPEPPTARNAMPEHVEPALGEETQHYARFIAMVVRNAMEDFHVRHLSDEQMKELNPIIRNAIATALHAFNHYEQLPAAKRYVDHQFRCIPTYWEPPELLEGYVKMLERDTEATE
jgi:hypothetical protein